MLQPLQVTTLIGTALGLGVVGSALAWPLRNTRQGRRALFAIWLAVLAAAVAAPVERFALLEAGAVPPPATFKVARAAWLFLAANAVLQLVDLGMWEGVLARSRRSPVPRLLINVLHVAVLVIVGLVIATRVFELPLSTLVVSSTVASAVLGLALQDVLRSMFAGLVLQLESPFSLGDWVEVGGYEGVITQMNWRTVTLRTRLRHHVVLTNGGVSSGEIINYSRPARLQGVDAFVGVAYAHPPEKVKATLREAVRDTPGLSSIPEPRVYTTSFDDFSIRYRIRYWITDYAALREVQDAVMTRVWYALRRAEMTIPFPIRDVNLHAVPENAGERANAIRRARITETLAPLDLLAPLDEAQIERLAKGAKEVRFAPGEVLMREGEGGDALYVLREGEVEIRTSPTDEAAVTVARRHPGDILGEMSLLTGAERSATVVADTEVSAVVVDQSAFADILLGDPTIAERLSEILAERELEQRARVAEADARVPSGAGLRDELLDRIRQIFGLG